MTPTAQFTKISRLVPPVSTSPSLALSILCLVSTLAGGCSADPKQDSPDQGTTNPSCPSSRLESAPAAAEPTYLPTSSSLRAAYLRGRQDERVSEHAFVPVTGALPALRAQNLEQNLEVSLDRAGLRLSSTRGGNGIGVSVRLTDQGCAAAPRAADSPSPQVVQPHRAEYDRPDITEWYVNGPMGLEHGFTVHRDLGCGDGRLAFTLELDGEAEASLAGQGATARIVVRNPKEAEIGSLLVYSGLLAVDADGRELPSRLSLSGRTVRLEVEASGARYPVSVDPMWTEQTRISDPDRWTMERFGWSVAISGDTAIVGQPKRKVDGNTAQGVAYVYVRTGTAWSQQAKLVASDGASNDQFGASIAIDGDTAVIGATMKTLGSNTNQGKAYVFVRTGTSWTQQAGLVASDGSDRESFGSTVAVSGDTAIVGSFKQSGMVYVYARRGTSWFEQAKLSPPPGDTGGYFGYRVAISGDTLAVGAWGTLVNKVSKGVAYVFFRSGSTWSVQGRLVASDGEENDSFGFAVSLSGDTLVVGAPHSLMGTPQPKGQAYVFVRSGSTWSEQAKLAAADHVDFGNFGDAVAISGDVAIVGAPLENISGKRAQGRAYVYLRAGTSWFEQTILTAADGAEDDHFGLAVAVSRDTALISAPVKSLLSGSREQGQVYLFIGPTASLLPGGTRCRAGTECQSSFCIDGVCCDSDCGGGLAGDCQACLGALTGGTDGTCGLVVRSARYACRPSVDVCDQAERCDGTNRSCPPDQRF